jgi:peptidyl-prolyl cis-trans isomerase C
MVKEFELAVWSTPLKTVSQPVKTQFGYHLIWVHERDSKE